MIPMDSYTAWSPRLDDAARQFLSPEELGWYEAIAPEERRAQLRDLLERPIVKFTPVNEAFFRAKWADALTALHPGAPFSLMEVGAGDADMIPQSLARSHMGCRYVTANMNKALTRSLLDKTAGLPLSVEVVEDDAAHIEAHFGPACFDAVAFQHSVNDVCQAILCEREGIDTVYSDWMAVLPDMIRILQGEVAAGTLERSLKGPFLSLMRSMLHILKPGGFVAINHYMFQLDLDWGYPPDLFAGFVPMAREWFRELDGVKEIRLDGFEGNWWLFLAKE